MKYTLPFTSTRKYVTDFLSLKHKELHSIKLLSGGTHSKVCLVNDEYVFKFNHKNVIIAEKIYANYYHDNPLTQKLVYVHPKNKFIVYKHIKGKVFPTTNNLEPFSDKIFEFIYNAKPYINNGYGDLVNPHKNWADFLMLLYKSAYKYLHNILPKQTHIIVKQHIKNLENYPITPKLLHGDLGLHNIIFNHNKLSRIIDPYPIVGDELYEIFFFIFSCIKITEQYDLTTIHTTLKQPKDKVRSMIILVLYIKIYRHIKYLKINEVSNYFIQLLNKMINL